MLNKNRIYYRICVFDVSKIISELNAANISLYETKQIEDYFYFSVSFNKEKSICKLFPELKPYKRSGIYALFTNLFKKKTTIISLIFSILVFFYFDTRIFEIKISGDSRIVSNLISNEIGKYDLKKYSRIPTLSHLLEYEEKIQESLYSQIEFIELRMIGVCLNIRFTKRRVSSEIPQNGSNIYAKKDGIISQIEVSSGEVMVKPNQYVKTGDLLVKETITTPREEELYVGTSGTIYGWTWTIIEQKEALKLDEVDAYVYMLDKATYMMSNGFSEKEYISKTTTLLFKNNDGVYESRFHFTCLENMGIN